MAYEIGTADGYTDLLDRLIDFLSNPNRAADSGSDIDELVAIDNVVESGEPSQAWTVLEYNDDRDSSGDGEVEVFLEGPGTSGVDEIYTWIDTVSNVTDDYYNWRLAGMTGYAAGADISLQPGVLQGRCPRMLMWKQPIPYWFFGNGRRYIVVAKISSVYEMCYAGFCLPYGLPTQFPYPLCIGGAACPSTTAANNRYSSTDYSHRAFPSPYGNNNAVCTDTFDNTYDLSSLKVLHGTSWIMMRNFQSGESTFYQTNHTWPYNCSYYQYSGGDAMPYNIFSTGLRENLDGSKPLFPVTMMISNPNKHIMGELEGCFACPGYGGLSAEDTINGGQYIAFPMAPNADRKEWVCIKKE